MTVVSLENVSLWRRTQEEFSYDIKQTILSIVAGKLRQPAKKLVLSDINFTVEAGETVGIVGANGAGKSTLLKVISGILKPTNGSVKVRGAIAPLIELGAGFTPEMSVTDNIIIYGVLLGFSRREMKLRIQPILEFAELEDYAFVPVKALSSGMKSRLGFAIATEVRPDILILDEVLAVGDASFRRKCKKRIERYWEANTTILVVSHDLNFVVNWCRRAIWLDKGIIKHTGSSQEVAEVYSDYSEQVKDKIKDKKK